MCDKRINAKEQDYQQPEPTAKRLAKWPAPSYQSEAIINLLVDSTEHYENTPIQIYRKFLPPKTERFRKKFLIFFIFLLKT